MNTTADFVVLPHNSTKIKDKHLVTNMMGCWDFLTPDEFKAFTAMKLADDPAFLERLQARGLVANESNLESILKGYRMTNANLFHDTALHLAVVTTKCNINCNYCHAHTFTPEDMTPEVATRVLKYLFDVKAKKVVLEIQGGEPLLNWPIVRMLAENARRTKNNEADLKICMVTNLTLMDDEKFKVLLENDVQICSSLDGPQEVHDHYRQDFGKRGTYQKVTSKAQYLKDKYGYQVSFLPTITRASLPHAKKIVDEFVRWEQPEICIRHVNNIGAASMTWNDLGYTQEEFCAFYAEAMDYLIELNKKGVRMGERLARVILTKILLKQDPGYVDMMQPCGAGRTTMAYMPNGGCYPCDEGRMVKDDIFRLGNIMTEDYQDMIKKDTLLNLLQASCTHLWHQGSAFSPWMGYCPVVNYAREKNVIPKVACSPSQKIQEFQFRYLFEKIMEGGETLDVLKSWLKGGPDDKEKSAS